MYPFDPRTLSPPVGDPSPLLEHLAGEFAARVAGLWRTPHAAFLTAPAERRQLVCLALALVGEAPLPAPADRLLELSLKRAVAVFVPEAPQGLLRALGRLGETAWTAQDYRTLLRLLAFGGAMKTLRHAERISPEAVRGLAVLQDDLLAAGFGRFHLTDEQAAITRDVFHHICLQQGVETARAAAGRWARADNLPALVRTMQLDLLPEIRPPPFLGTARLKPLRSKAEMAAVADRFGNCLRSRVRYAVTGDAAYFEWTEAPGAVVEIWRDHLFGWRLDEARAPRNDPVPPATREAITAELRAMGVHVGVRGGEFENAVGRASRPGFRRPDVAEVIGELYGD